MKNNRIYLSPPHMSEKERANLTNACPEFTEISKGIRLYLIAPLGPQIWKLIK